MRGSDEACQHKPEVQPEINFLHSTLCLIILPKKKKKPIELVRFKKTLVACMHELRPFGHFEMVVWCKL
jgi:hypothetical protein